MIFPEEKEGVNEIRIYRLLHKFYQLTLLMAKKATSTFLNMYENITFHLY